MTYEDRTDAGRRLAQRLAQYQGRDDAIVLGIPRGGVVVAYEVARELGLPMDVAVAAKVSAPGSPEYAIGAVAPDGAVTANPVSGYSLAEVQAYSAEAFDKVERYMGMLRPGRAAIDLSGLTVLLVDDGLATGLTARAAAEWVRRQGAAQIVVGVPVASPSSIGYLGEVADNVVADTVPAGFAAVGQFYRRFDQTTDDEVRTLLARLKSGKPGDAETLA